MIMVIYLISTKSICSFWNLIISQWNWEFGSPVNGVFICCHGGGRRTSCPIAHIFSRRQRTTRRSVLEVSSTDPAKYASSSSDRSREMSCRYGARTLTRLWLLTHACDSDHVQLPSLPWPIHHNHRLLSTKRWKFQVSWFVQLTKSSLQS
jgi:hypothetical protein